MTEKPGRTEILAESGPAGFARENILATKLYAPPPRLNLVSRPRLTERLAQGLALGCKLTLISAPAGFGKTTVVCEWLRQMIAGEQSFAKPGNRSKETEDKVGSSAPLLPGSPAQVAWLSLDEEDNDPARFFTYLVAALQKLDHSIGRGLHLFPQLPPVEMLITALINDLATLAGTVVLVLDDYHLIHNPLIHEAISLLLDHQPPQVHVTLATREDPPLSLSRLRVRGQLVEIRQEDLRFTTGEAMTFMDQTMRLNLSPEAVAAIETRTEGWVAGLQLAAISMQGQDGRGLANFIDAFSGSHRYVIDYLIEEVIQQQPAGVRQFLSQTAILDRLTAPLCDAVVGRADSQQLLTHLEQANLFLIPLDDQRQWYRYHHLFAEFLRTEVDRQQQAKLHGQAARWFESHGLLPEAIKHALAAKEVAEAERLIILAAPDALGRGALTTLNGWLEGLPDDIISANYELATCKGWVLWMMGQGAAAESYLQLAEANMPESASRRSRGRLVSLQALLTLGHQGDDGLQLAQAALDLVDEDDFFFRNMTLLVMAEVRNYMGDAAGAAQAFQEIFQLGQQLNDPMMTIGGAMNLAQQWNWQGKRGQAVTICRQLIDRLEQNDDKSSPILNLVYNTLAEMEYYANNLDQAQQFLDRGAKLSQRHTLIWFAITGKMALAPLQNALGQTEEALATTRELIQFITQSNFDAYIPIFTALEALYLLRLGHIAAAERWAIETDLSPEDNPTPMRNIEYLVYTRLLLAQNRPAEARTLLAKIEQLVKAGKRYFFLIEVYVLQALTYTALDNEAEALAALEKAVDLAAPEEYRRHFLDEGPAIAALLPKVRRVAPEFVDSLLAAFGQQPFADNNQMRQVQKSSRLPRSPAPQPLIESLSERERELLQLIAVGQSNREVAETLVITVGTVKKHLNNIFGKLGVKNRTQAVARARELGLI